MNKEDVRKNDWKILQSKIPQWQEQYMAELLKSYISFLENDTLLPSYRFHELEKRIKIDKHKVGVSVTLDKKEMEDIIAELIMTAAIKKEELKEFSDELQKEVEQIIRRRRS